MSVILWYQETNNAKHAISCRNKDEAIEILGRNLTLHINRGEVVSDLHFYQDPYVIYSVKNAKGDEVARYWIEEERPK